MTGRGALIVLEGFEGAGKTTRAAALQTALAKSGKRCEVVREPGGDPFAEELRRILKESEHEITPWAEAFSFCAARANMLQLKVRPLLAAGCIVISDRNYISTLAYQGWGNQWPLAELDRLRQICKLASQAATPDLTIVLDVDYDTAMARVAARPEGSDRIEARSGDYHRRVLEGYHREAELGHHVIVDANQTPHEVDAAVLAAALKVVG